MSDWRKYCSPKKWHEAAKLFPLMSAEDLNELTTDIDENGLQNPVVLLDDLVLDGRNRILACDDAGVEPEFTTWSKTDISPIAWVISQNLMRRHLEAGQRACIAVEAKPLLLADAEKNKSRLSGRPKKNAETPDKNDRGFGSRRKVVAEKFDVSEAYVQAAEKIKNKDVAVFERVKAGEINIPEAEKELGFKQSTIAMVSADSNEWYTPENYLVAAREVLGKFDLDPASCATANKVVKAKEYFNEEDDGLSKKWKGNIWMNPPYGDVGPKFVAKMIEEYENGDVEEAIVLLNSHCTDAKWFKPLFDYTLCFTDHRSKFWNKDGLGGSPTHGSVFVYFGENKEKFRNAFKQFGSIVHKYRGEKE